MKLSLSDTFRKAGALFLDKDGWPDSLKLGIAFGAVTSMATYAALAADIPFTKVEIIDAIINATFTPLVATPFMLSASKPLKEFPESDLFYGGLSGLAKNYARMALGLGVGVGVVVSVAQGVQKLTMG